MASKISRQGAKLRKGIKNGHSRFKSFVAASVTRVTFADLKTRLEKNGFTAMSTKAMSLGPGEAWIRVGGKYERYRISRTGEEVTYSLEEQLDTNSRPQGESKTDANGSSEGQSKPVPDFSQQVLAPVSAQNSGEGNVWPPPGAARYGMFKPDPVSPQSQQENVSQPQPQQENVSQSQAQQENVSQPQSQNVQPQARQPASKQLKPVQIPEPLGFDRWVKVSDEGQVTTYIAALGKGEHLVIFGEFGRGTDTFDLTPS